MQVGPAGGAGGIGRTMDGECFPILPHPQVGEYVRRTVNGRDCWVAGMLERISDARPI